MELKDLGFSDWFLREQPSGKKGSSTARVTAVNRDNYLVRNENGETLAEPAGEFLFSADSGDGLPVVGDWAHVRYFNDDTLAIIDGLFPRKTLLRRKTAGKKVEYQMIAANIDIAFVMQSCDFDFNLRRLERYLVMVRDGRIEPVILLSKSDLVDRDEVERRITALRTVTPDDEIIAVSNETSAGLERVRQLLGPGRTGCLLGSSGVGKTTLLNSLIGREAFATAAVREKDSRGRHTTSRRQLTVLDDGGMLVDTPGIRELGNIDTGEGIDDVFSDIGVLAGGCRFTDCTHTAEAGCRVRRAVAEGVLSEARYESYLKLLKESEYHGMSYLEKRQKDRKFGRFLKSYQKNYKKYR